MPHEGNDPALDSALAALEPGFLAGNGRFTLVRLLGRGGMGVVWLARDESLREDVALKFLPPEIRFDAVAIDDLRRETSRSRRLTHPNIIRIHDLYKDEREAFISMEYVEGSNLSDLRLEQGDRVFPWSTVEPLVRQLCDALEYAHGEGIVHRDLKPLNMMLDRRGRLKLADFGIAAVVSDSISRVSLRHATSGTVTHMSPQQMDGRMPQVTDDIYAVGATLYELLTSRPPFYTGDIAHQVRHLAPAPIAERLAEFSLENDVPSAVAAMIMACLSKDPAQRPPSARAVAEWIGLQPATRTTEIPPPAPAPVVIAPAARVPTKQARILPPVDEAAFAETAPEVPPEKPRRSSRSLIGAGAAALVLCAATVTVVLLQKDGNKRRDEPATNVVAATPPQTSSIPAATAVAALIPATTTQPAPAPPGDAANAEVLFDGGDLSKWSGDKRFYKVVNGELTAFLGEKNWTRNPICLTWRGGEFSDFRLRLLCRYKEGNCGIIYRGHDLADWKGSLGGYEFTLQPAEIGSLVDHPSNKSIRSLVRRSPLQFAREVSLLWKADDWNEIVITARGNHIEHRINGTVVVDRIDNYPLAPTNGAIGLKLMSKSGGEPAFVAFKRITVERLTPAAPAAAVRPAMPVTQPTVAPTAASASHFHLTPLFFDRSLNGWNPTRANSWQADTTFGTTGWGARSCLVSRQQFANFELSAEVKFSAGNIGTVIFRAPASGDGGYALEVKGQALGKLGEGGMQPTFFYSHTVPAETWHRQHIYAVGNKFLVYINDRLAVNYSPLGTPPASGHLVLQQWLENGSVSYRNVRARALSSNDSAAWTEARKQRPDLPPNAR